MKNKLFLIVFTISIVFKVHNAMASFAAEPHGDEHLHKYAEKPEFDASVPIERCSASRIKISEDDPIDFYTTAAHCFEPKEDIPAPMLSAIIGALKEINHLSIDTPLNQINIKEIVEKHFSPFSDDQIEQMFDKTNSRSKAELVFEFEHQLKLTSPKAILSALLEPHMKNAGIIQQKDIDYIKHPELDLAVFTTNKQSNEAKYALYKGDLNDLLGKEVTNVAFGNSFLKGMFQPKSERKRQAFDSSIESLSNKDLYSEIFRPDLNRTLADSPIGYLTPGDCGGSLLVKEQDEYKLIGVPNNIRPFYHNTLDTNNDIIEAALSIYEGIPESLRSHIHNQYCFHKLKTFGTVFHDCYGTANGWTGIDFSFVKNAKKDLLAKKEVHAYPLKTKAGDPAISFSLRNGLNEHHLEKQNNFIGYASAYAKLNVLIDGEEILTIPFQLGRTSFIYQLKGKDYPMEMIIEETLDGKAYLVKANILYQEEKDQCVAYNPFSELMMNNNNERCNKMPSFVKSVYRISTRFDISNTLPIQVSLDNCLSNKNFVDTDLLGSGQILGYGNDNYEVVISLNGKELKKFRGKELKKHWDFFQFQYDGNTYNFSISKLEEQNKDTIYIECTGVQTVEAEKNEVYNSRALVDVPGTVPEDFIPVYFIRSCGNAGDAPVNIELIKGTELEGNYFAKKNSEIKVTIAGKTTHEWPINKEGCYCVNYYQNNGILYAIELNIQKVDSPKKYYSVDLRIRELEAPANMEVDYTILHLTPATEPNC